MNAIQLKKPDGTNVAAWMCGECGRIWPESDSYSSDYCCRCSDCGGKIHYSQHLCDKCWGPHYARLTQGELDKATIVDDYDGPVNIGEKFWQTPEECRNNFGDNSPEFAFCCHVESYSLDAETILQDLLENAGIDGHDESNLDGVTDFARAVEAFNEANKSNVYWLADTSRKARIKAVK